MRHRFTAAAGMLAFLALLGGCNSASSTDPAPSPATSATTVTPSTTPTPSVTLAQAEKTYRALVEAQYQAQKQGGVSPDATMPAGITRNAEGQALADYKDVLNQTFNKGSHWVSGTYKITGVARSDDHSNPDAQIALVSCEDWRAIHTSWADGSKDQGLLIKTTSWYHLGADGTVKQIAYDSNKVTTCDVK